MTVGSYGPGGGCETTNRARCIRGDLSLCFGGAIDYSQLRLRKHRDALIRHNPVQSVLGGLRDAQRGHGERQRRHSDTQTHRTIVLPIGFLPCIAASPPELFFCGRYTAI